MILSDESNSKQTFKILWTCRFQAPSTFPVGERKITTKEEYVVDATAESIVQETGVDPNSIDTAYKLSSNYEQRIKFQADIQDYVDMSISSTINLPPWNTKGNSEPDVGRFASILAQYAPRLRGFTCYPDGSRGGQPITEVAYEDAIKHRGIVYQEHDVCQITGKGGSCGV